MAMHECMYIVFDSKMLTQYVNSHLTIIGLGY